MRESILAAVLFASLLNCGGPTTSTTVGTQLNQSSQQTALEEEGSGRPSVEGNSRLTLGPEVFGVTVEMRRFVFEADLRRNGTAEGEYDFREIDDGNQLFTASGPITCLVVRNNRAWLGGTIRNSNDPTVVGQDSWWQVVDNHRVHRPDRTTFLGVGRPGLAQDYCDRAPEPRFIFDLQHGHIRVGVDD